MRVREEDRLLEIPMYMYEHRTLWEKVCPVGEQRRPDVGNDC